MNFLEFQSMQGQTILRQRHARAAGIEWASRAHKVGGSPLPAATDTQMERRAEDCAPYQRTPGVVELVVRPTGLIDPKVTLKPLKGQIDDLIEECRRRADAKERVLVTTLTSAREELTITCATSVSTCVPAQRELTPSSVSKNLRALRKGEFDVLVGITCCARDWIYRRFRTWRSRRGQGRFLRSETSLIQTAAARAPFSTSEVIPLRDVMTQHQKIWPSPPNTAARSRSSTTASTTSRTQREPGGGGKPCHLRIEAQGSRCRPPRRRP